jgi:hypothetical protein
MSDRAKPNSWTDAYARYCNSFGTAGAHAIEMQHVLSLAYWMPIESRQRWIRVWTNKEHRKFVASNLPNRHATRRYMFA